MAAPVPQQTSASSSLAALLTSVLVLVAGNSLLNTLVPLRASLDSFPPLVIGILGSAYYFGMLAGTLAAPAVMTRVGYIRAFAAFTAGAIAAALTYSLYVTPLVWVGLRCALGFTFAGLYGVIDSWINSKSSNANRGRVYALYQIINFGGSAVGQQMTQLSDPRGFRLFSTSAILFAFAIVPLALTSADAPAQPRARRLRLLWLLRVAPIGAATVFIVGATNGAFFSLAPIYALDLGGSSAAVSSFMTATVIGSAVMVWPVGRLSDVFDRRVLLAGLTAIGAVLEAMLWSQAVAGPTQLAVVGFGIGCATMVLYTLGITHTNDRAGPDRVVEVSSGLLFIYCVAAIVAPTAASLVMGRFGVSALFGQNALLHMALAIFTISLTVAAPAWRRRRGGQASS